MKTPLYPIQDEQQAPVIGKCARCGFELYHPTDGDLCQACEAQLRRYDQHTLQDVMEELDFHLQKVLADGPRIDILNTLATKFNLQN